MYGVFGEVVLEYGGHRARVWVNVAMKEYEGRIVPSVVFYRFYFGFLLMCVDYVVYVAYVCKCIDDCRWAIVGFLLVVICVVMCVCDIYIMLVLMIDVRVCYWYGGVMYVMSVVEVVVVCWDYGGDVRVWLLVGIIVNHGCR